MRPSTTLRAWEFSSKMVSARSPRDSRLSRFFRRSQRLPLWAWLASQWTPRNRSCFCGVLFFFFVSRRRRLPGPRRRRPSTSSSPSTRAPRRVPWPESAPAGRRTWPSSATWTPPRRLGLGLGRRGPRSRRSSSAGRRTSSVVPLSLGHHPPRRLRRRAWPSTAATAPRTVPAGRAREPPAPAPRRPPFSRTARRPRPLLPWGALPLLREAATPPLTPWCCSSRSRRRPPPPKRGSFRFFFRFEEGGRVERRRRRPFSFPPRSLLKKRGR
mmetsp:Transcript_20336/g.65514  ORF Transcript_20336/g.65514 Transcript_20336/m.65514 type:complete len:270 (+) Transcript_20336:894-1703(+)